jgi:phage terminase large subunit-like protein
VQFDPIPCTQASEGEGRLRLTECDRFTFDAVAADRVVRFIETFCRHYQGRHAGQPFILHERQRVIVRDLFGWKHRATGLRRFTHCYFEAAVGAGKSPLLAALGLYGLMADGEPGAQVYSLASSFGQARVVFDTAKRFARASPEILSRLEIVDREMRYPRGASVWKIVSGKGPGAGCAPSMILADEIADWQRATAYDDLESRMFKRQQPLLIAATNAGETRASFCWQLRERAMAVLDGRPGADESLYPVIWCASEDARTDDPAAWRLANPLIGTTISESSIRAKCIEAARDPVEEAKFRRLYLGVWPKTAGGRWLDLSQFDAVCHSFNASSLKDFPLFVGLDLSQGDDLCAASFIWVTPERFYVGSHFWLPRATATHYRDKEEIPYLAWADRGDIELIDEPTISPAIRKMIAARIITLAKTHKIKAVCYDRYRADDCIAALEGAGVTCVPIAQGFSISPGTYELERRIKEQSITIAPNTVSRFCAENCEVKGDDRGNLWPAKPNARGKYAGRRGAKIDFITATVTALTEARKHSFPAAKREWAGSISGLRQ